MTRVEEARRVLGVRLRELRESARLSGRALATIAEWDASKVSKIEHGKQMPSEDDLATWCRLTDADLALPDLIATARNINAAYIEWRRIAASGHAGRQRQSIKTEAETKLVRGYDALILPGLLQTRDYAEAIISRCIGFLGGPDDLADAVAMRLKRQRVLHAGLHRFHFLIGEPALHTSVGDESIRLAQLEHLLEVMTLPRLMVGIVPVTAEFFYETTNFLMYDRRMVQVETISAELTITQPRELVLYEKAFQALAERAVIGEAARGLIRAALESRR